MYLRGEFYTLIDIVEDNEFVVKATIRTVILLFLYKILAISATSLVAKPN